MKLAELAERLNAKLEGDGTTEITGVRGIEEATASEITFVANPKYAALARTTQAAAVLVDPDFPAIATPTLRLANPYLAFAQALGLFYQPPGYPPGIHSTAVVDPSASIGSHAHIGAYAVIGPNVRVGDHATILPHVVLYPAVTVGDFFFAHAHAIVREGCILGDHVTLENGAIIGSDGFGFARDSQGSWIKIPQSGPVRVGNHVDVQANACIDRATVGATEIADGTKIDNLVQIGHGSKVGKNTLVCAQAGLAGSSVVGANAILAGQAGVAGHCTLGDGVILTAQSGVSHDVPAGKMLSGSPAFENRSWLRAVAALQRLPEMLRRLNRLEKAAGQTGTTAGKIFSILTLFAALLFLSGCRSDWVDVSVENRTGQTIRELEVNYPTASFGFDSVGAGSLMHYRLQIRGSGPVRVGYTLPDGKTIHAVGTVLTEHQHGQLGIQLLSEGKIDFQPNLHSAP